MIKYETLPRRKMIQLYKKNSFIQKQERVPHSRTLEMSPFSNQNYFTHKTLYRPTSASLNNKINFNNTLKKSNCFKKLLNQSKDHRIDNEDFIRISEKFVESYKNKNKMGNQNKFFNHFWEDQLQKNANKKIRNAEYPKKIQIKIKNAIQSAQSTKINSFEQFIQSRKRIQTRKKNHTRTQSEVQNKSILNRNFQVFGHKKEVQLKKCFIDVKRCENSSLEYKQLYKKYLEKLVQEQTDQLKELRPSSALDSIQNQGLTIDTTKKSLPTGMHTEEKDQRMQSKIDKYYEKKVPTRKLLIEKSKKFSNQLIQKHQSTKVKKENVITHELEGWKNHNQDQFDFVI